LAEEAVTYTKYRWLLLSLAWALMCLTAYNNMMQNVRYDLLLPVAEGGLGLTRTQFYLCITATSLAPVVVNLPSGLLADRIGVKRVILYGAIVAVCAALLRLAATGFIDLFIYCVVMGVGLGTLSGNVPKLVGMWFPVRQMYLGVAALVTALGLGPFLALATGAMWPSYFVGFLVMGLLLAVMCVVWAIWAKDRPKEYLEDGRAVVGVPVRESLLTVIRSKHLWLILLAIALLTGVGDARTGGIPLFLVQEREVPQTLAGLVIALGIVGYIVGIMLWPWVAEKWGYMKPVFAVCMAVSGITGFLTIISAPGIGMWPFAFTSGLFIGAGPPLVMQMPLRLKGIGTRYAGAAMGLISSFTAAMSFAFLPFVFTPIWEEVGPLYGIGFMSLCVLVSGALFLIVPEVGRKAREKWTKEAAQTQVTAS
jgi:MFS family permease